MLLRKRRCQQRGPMRSAKPFVRKAESGHAEARARLKIETRSLLHLGDDVTVTVSELSCPESGCAEIETIVAVMIAGKKPLVARIGKKAIDVTRGDLMAAFVTMRL
jgi:hypothetical protein